MTTAQIEYFLAVATCLNFTEASKKLFVAQSSLSRNIASLEEELGLKLFIRTKKFVRLTPAGAVLYEEFTKINDQLAVSLSKARQAEEGKDLKLQIGIIEAQEAEHFLPSAIAQLTMLYPTITIDLVRGNFKALRNSLKSREIDIAITLDFDLNSYKDQDILYESLYTASGDCVISSHHPLAKKADFKMSDLKDETAIAIDPDISFGGYNNLLEFCKRHGFSPKKIRTASTIEDIVLMVESGLGYTVLDENCKLRHNSSLICVNSNDDVKLAALAIWRKDNYNPAISLFIRTLSTNSHLMV